MLCAYIWPTVLHLVYYMIIAILLIISWILILILLSIIDTYIYRFMPYWFITCTKYYCIHLLLALKIPKKYWYKMEMHKSMHSFYNYFKKKNNRYIIKGIHDLPTDKPILFYQEHIACNIWDCASLYIYNMICNKSVQCISSKIASYPEGLYVIDADPMLDNTLHDDIKLCAQGTHLIRESLHTNMALFIIATGFSCNTTGSRDNNLLYEYKHKIYAKYHKFKPGFLLFSQGARLAPVKMTIDYPKWVQWLGQLPLSINYVIHIMLEWYIYSHRTLYITYGQPLDDQMVKQDRKTVILKMNQLQKKKNTLKTISSCNDHKDQIHHLQQEIDALDKQIQEILDKYEDYMHDLDHIGGVDFERLRH